MERSACKILIGVLVAVLIIAVVGTGIYFIIMGTKSSPSSPFPLPHPAPDVLFLVKTSLGSIESFNLQTAALETLVLDWPHRITTFDYYLNHTIYYATSKPYEPIISSSLEYQNITQYADSWTKTAMAVDSVSEKLYVVDRELNRLYLTDLEDNYSTVLLSDLDEPKDVVFDLEEYLMFIAQNSSILLANMDGSNARIVFSHLHAPLTAIAIDVNNKLIYFATLNAIQSLNYINGTMINDVLNIEGEILSLSFAKDHLFFVHEQKTGRRAFSYCPIIDGYCKNLQVAKVAEYVANLFLDIKTYELDQPALNNPCGENNGECDHLCVLISQKPPYTCACSIGWKLDADEKTCTRV